MRATKTRLVIKKYREAYWDFMQVIDPEHSRPLDVHRWSDHPEIKVLTDEIWMEITEIEGLVTIPTGNRKPWAPLITQLRVLLVDLYVAWLADPTLSIGISRSNNSFTPKSRHNGLHISKDILKVVDALVAVGLDPIAHTGLASTQLQPVSQIDPENPSAVYEVE